MSPIAPAGESARGSSALSSRMSAWTRSTGTPAGGAQRFTSSRYAGGYAMRQARMFSPSGGRAEGGAGARPEQTVRGAVIAGAIEEVRDEQDGVRRLRGGLAQPARVDRAELVGRVARRARA